MVNITGGCHCGAIRYQADGEAHLSRALPLHGLPASCRRADGRLGDVSGGAAKVTKGTPKVYASSRAGRRHFCPDCGTGLFYTNAPVLPGIIDIQSATFDDPAACRPRCTSRSPIASPG